MFSASSKIVSLAKESTSYQLLPSLSVHDTISITSAFDNLISEYFSAELKLKNSVVMFPLSTFTCFFNKYLVTVPLSLSNIEVSRGLKELEKLKFTSSKVLNVVPLLVAVTAVPAFTVRAYLKSGLPFRVGTVWKTSNTDVEGEVTFGL